jgi:hypothetical protein
VHPVVLDAFESGQLRELRAQMRRNNGTTRTGYSLDERLVLKLLETQG